MSQGDKHVKLEQKTALIRDQFNLPVSLLERVVQDYRSSLDGHGGKSYVTPQHLFHSSGVKVSLARVERVERVGSRSVELSECEGGPRHVVAGFTSSGKRDELWALLEHFVEHPLSLRSAVRAEAETHAVVDSRVDTEAGVRAQRKAYGALESGIETLGELERQKEAVRQMEAGLDQMESDLAAANRHLRGIESVGGSLANRLTPGVTGGGPRSSRLLGGQSSLVPVAPPPGQRPPCQLSAVWKAPNDDLQPCLLLLDSRGLRALSPEGTELGRALFAEMEALVWRARPLHCDVRLTHDRRLRVVSSQAQTLTAELKARCETLVVDFERNAIEFDFGVSLLAQPTTPTDYNYISDAGVRAGFRIQDEQLDGIDKAARQLQLMGLDMGDELDASVRQIAALNQHTDKVGSKIATTNARVERLL